MNKDLLRRKLDVSNNKLSSHLMLYKDNTTNEEFTESVSFSENPNEVRYDLLTNNNTIISIYNYSLDLEEQLKEENPYHIEPLMDINPSKEELGEALEFATHMHRNQYRKDGSLYINHPIRVASLVDKYYSGRCKNLLIEAAFLHDVVEDTDTKLEYLITHFGPYVSSIVHELTTDSKLRSKFGKEDYLAGKVKNMSSLSLIVKLCDRLDNLSDLGEVDIEFRNKMIKQTLSIVKTILDYRTFEKAHLDIVSGILKQLKNHTNDIDQINLIDDMNESLTRKKLTDSVILKLLK